MKREALEAFLKELKGKFGDRIEEVIVFGSYARGDYDEESDIDVLIVGDVPFDDVIEISTEILLKYGELISPMVISPEEFRRRNDSFILTVKREGLTSFLP